MNAKKLECFDGDDDSVGDKPSLSFLGEFNETKYLLELYSLIGFDIFDANNIVILIDLYVAIDKFGARRAIKIFYI